MSGKKKEIKRVTNNMFSADANFERACERAGVEATKRQASKFRLGKGSAFKYRKQVKEDN
jgi:hypothetical protein